MRSVGSSSALVETASYTDPSVVAVRMASTCSTACFTSIPIQFWLMPFFISTRTLPAPAIPYAFRAIPAYVQLGYLVTVAYPYCAMWSIMYTHNCRESSIASGGAFSFNGLASQEEVQTGQWRTPEWEGKAFDFEGAPATYANCVDTRGHPSLYSPIRKPILIPH
jgi:hypothetical protein